MKKIILKEFIKPTITKIILTVISAIILCFLFISTLYDHGGSKYIFYLLYWPLLSLGFLLNMAVNSQGNLNNFLRVTLFGIALLGELIYIYIFSSLIIWIFNKLKNKK